THHASRGAGGSQIRRVPLRHMPRSRPLRRRHGRGRARRLKKHSRFSHAATFAQGNSGTQGPESVHPCVLDLFGTWRQRIEVAEIPMPSPRLNLFVLRAPDIESAQRFYALLGLSFTKHAHGSGPLHYAADSNGFILEIYPQTEADSPTTGVRIGFKVRDLDATI